MEQFLPPTLIASLAIGLSIARFENQRWVRERASGLRGASEGLGLFVDFTGLIALLFAVAFLIAFLWEFGWRPTIGLIAMSTAVGLAWSMVIPDSLAIRFLATLAIWPLAILLAWQISWFGMLG